MAVSVLPGCTSGGDDEGAGADGTAGHNDGDTGSGTSAGMSDGATDDGGATGSTSGPSSGDGTDSTTAGDGDGDGDGECEAPQIACGDDCCELEDLVELPVEIFGPEGTIESRSLTLDAAVAVAGTHLALRVNNLGYEGKGSVRVNGGEWTSFTHDAVTVEPAALARGGMAHGGLSTLWIEVATGDLVAGDNSVEFRFDLGNGISNGYRVVDMQVRSSTGEDLLPPWATYPVDPATWEAPLAGSDAVDAGRALWYGAALWSHDLPNDRTGFWYDKVIEARRPIQATCSDCHTQDGRDLEIFAYSNRSIADRARFHGLTETEGQQIASYIRSLSSTANGVGRYGRPWNPPFQPGPTVANLPPEQWPAGAGLEAVLERDADMAPHMFGTPVTEQSVKARFDSTAMVDRTTLPLAIQFPDWKHWLPMVHPKDAYNRNNWYDDLAAGYDPTCSGGSNNCTVHPDSAYANLRDYLSAMPPQDRATQDLLDEFSRYWFAHRAFFAMGTTWRHWRSKDAAANLQGLAAGADFADMEFAATSLARLMSVKLFEFHHEFELADKAQVMLGEAGDQVPARQWFGEEYQVFEIPPHFTACFDPSIPVGKDCQRFEGQLPETGKFESTAWYHLQSIVNGGNGQVMHNSPVDYNYQQEHTMAAASLAGIEEPLRMLHQLNTMYQTRTWSGGDSPNTGRGFRIRVMGPWLFYGLSQKGSTEGWQLGEIPEQLDAIHPGLKKWSFDAFLEQFLREMEQPYNDLGTWDRVAPHGDDNALDPATKTMSDILLVGDPGFVTNGQRWAGKVYTMVELYAEAGVECSTLDRYVDWGERAWPLLDWDDARRSFTATADLHPREDGIHLVLGSPGSSPTVEWTVNGSPISVAGNLLAPSAYGSGDTVEVTVQSDDTCLPGGARQASASLVVP